MIWIFCIGLLSAATLAAECNATRGLDHFYNLEYDSAIVEFERCVAERPGSPEAHNLVAQGLLFREMYRVGALESELVTGANSFLRRPKMTPSPEVQAHFDRSIQTVMDLTGPRIEQNPKDTEALYARGVAFGLRANYNFLVKKAWRAALSDATDGRKLHNKVSEVQPGNYDARLVQGIHDYVVGSLPWGVRLLGFLIGFNGDREKGIQTLREVALKGDRNKVDAEIFLCALYRREKKPKEALPLLEDLVNRFPRNYLLRFEQAQMYSDIGDKTKAIAAIERVAEMKRSGASGFADLPWEKIFFRLGTVQFWYRDYPAALDNMKKVTAGGDKLDLNTGSTAWMRMGQIYDLTSRREEAVDAYKKAISFAPEAEAAKESRRYLDSPYQRKKA
ncbi:MAG: tetratricopeptide repeat protein [Bryobacteraceae bacterium]